MLEVAIRDTTGNTLGQAKVDEEVLGGHVRPKVMHQAVVRHLGNRRVGSHCTKTRGEIAGSTKKPWRQKGTGRARAGTKKSPIWVGGGVIFGPKPRDYRTAMPKKARRAARRSAVLAKLQDGEVVVVEALDLATVKTKEVASVLKNLGLSGMTTLIVTAMSDKTLYLSARNIPGVTVTTAADMNTYDVLRHKRVLMTRAALDAFCAGDERASPEGSEPSSSATADAGGEG